MILKFDLFLSLITKANKRWLILLGFLSLISGFLDVVAMSILMLIVSYGMQGTMPSHSWWDKFLAMLPTHNSSQNVFILSTLLIFLFLGKNVFSLMLDAVIARYVAAIRRNIGMRLFQNYLKCPYLFKVQRSSTMLYNKVTHEVGVLAGSYVGSSIYIISAAMTALLILSWMIYKDAVTFSVVSLVMLLTLYFNHKWTKRKMYQKAKLRAEAMQHQHDAVLTPIYAFRETQLHQVSHFFTQRYYQSARTLANVDMVMNVIQKMPKALFEVTMVFTVMALMMWAMLSGSVQGFFLNISVFAFALFRLLPIAVQMSSFISSAQGGRFSLETIYNEIQLTDRWVAEVRAGEQRGVDTTKPFLFEKEIELKDVFFSYAKEEEAKSSWVLRGVTLRLKKNKIYALVGSSGGGKTTLVDVITGLLKPDQGEVLVDGVSIHTAVASWWKRIGYIPQHIHLMNATVRENIAFGMDPQEIDDQKVARAIRIACLEDVVSKLEGGVHTIIGENGMQLSGGQRQRVGIARALYNDPDVLILDEATASLDNISEFAIMQSIQKMTTQKTIIIIAHRLSTVERCDGIFVISDGRVVDEGTFEHLSQHSDLMQKMLKPLKP